MAKRCAYMSWVLAGLLLVACEDWLDVQPKTSIQEKELYRSESGFKDVLTGFYIKLGNTGLYGKDLTYGFPELLAGRYDNTIVAANLYNYQKEYESLKNNIWAESYNLIANINNFLYYIDRNREVIRTADYYEIMKGEALGLRAFLHFDLLRLFGPVYGMNPTAESICYRTRLDKLATPRLPAVAVIDSVLRDLKQAESLLDGHDNEQFSADEYNEDRDAFLVLRQLRMNIWAVRAMLARVYLYKGDEASKTLAYDYARQVMACPYVSLAESNAQNRILFSEHLFSLHIYEMEKLMEADFGAEASDKLYALQETIDGLYEKGKGYSTDFRQNNYYFQHVGGKLVCRKFDQSRYAGKYDGAEIMPLIRLPEMYYIAAECTPDAAESADLLNTVRHFRSIPESLDIQAGEDYDKPDRRPGTDQSKTFRVNELLKEYQKEFYGEGQLFYFYKRHFYRSFFNCRLSGELQPEHYIPQVPDDEKIFGNYN
ncbi:RagB/SusD family nutrient uptake outer membrane protein [Odoribacter sp. Z80]|uniref:RagB/SusD family nutrient uptake outer membrane protein n=1 Tax=Odoribacter sp. Z80 TaxID=2304575 RepID=UPI001F397DC5|nr:RagB/SusD family nutrient uptake outer membrane protein [Odoribacter sp. Z80]